MSKNIMLDLTCLSKGLPPLSMGARCALEMINQLESNEKRLALRKIRKFSKLEIDRRCKAEFHRDKFSEECYRESLRKRIDLSNKDNKPLRNNFLLARLEFTKSYLEREGIAKVYLPC